MKWTLFPSMDIIYSNPKLVSHDTVTDLILLVVKSLRPKARGIVRVNDALSCERMELYTKRWSLAWQEGFYPAGVSLLVLVKSFPVSMDLHSIYGKWIFINKPKENMSKNSRHKTRWKRNDTLNFRLSPWAYAICS